MDVIQGSVSAGHRATPRRLRRDAFTLVELLVVIGIIAMLIALLVPAVQAARESARRTQCGNNLKQIATAVEAHKSLIGHFPTGGWDGNSLTLPGNGSDWRQPRGWCFTIQPFADGKSIYDAAGADTSTDVPIFVCPSRRGSSVSPAGMVMTDYAGNRGAWASPTPANNAAANRLTIFGWQAGVGTLPTTGDGWAAVASSLNAPQPVLSGTGTVPTGGVIFAGSALAPAAVRDGASSTYLCAEKYVPRPDYTALPTGYRNCAYVGDSEDTLRGGHRPPESDATPSAAGLEGAFGGPHQGTFMAAMCDGSVRGVGFDIDAAVHFLLSCRADRQAVQVP